MWREITSQPIDRRMDFECTSGNAAMALGRVRDYSEYNSETWHLSNPSDDTIIKNIVFSRVFNLWYFHRYLYDNMSANGGAVNEDKALSRVDGRRRPRGASSSLGY
ncbi:uncharacterized protein [Fopius arisanus]|uniref:Uncharacterized protein isoform X2 n=1 Tax=Fopius arisanus TaxID=64838 RepID=A0A9R1TDA0_9HYME|nr:PREDICTED: uncharacterized protein LOC105268896 isoform X2 [Fopius arisanus]